MVTSCRATSAVLGGEVDEEQVLISSLEAGPGELGRRSRPRLVVSSALPAVCHQSSDSFKLLGWDRVLVLI